MQIFRKNEIPLIFIVALLTYFIQSIAWPFTLGRDGANYLLYFLEIFSKEPVYNIIILMRTPIAPLLYGSLLSIRGSIFAEIILGFIYSGAILGIYFIARLWSKKIAVIAALLVNAFPAYGAIYHTISSEAPLAFICLASMLILFYTVLGAPSYPAMRVLFEPLLMLFGIIGIREIILKSGTMRRFGFISRFL